MIEPTDEESRIELKKFAWQIKVVTRVEAKVQKEIVKLLTRMRNKAAESAATSQLEFDTIQDFVEVSEMGLKDATDIAIGSEEDYKKHLLPKHSVEDISEEEVEVVGDKNV